MRKQSCTSSFPLAALLALALVAFTALVSCSEDKGEEPHHDPEYGTPEFWEQQWQKSLARFGCPQPTDTIEGWKLAGLRTGVVPDNTDSNLVMQIREHDGTLIIRTYRGDMWTAHFPELEWARIHLPSKAAVKKLVTQGDSILASTFNAELWTAKFKDFVWRKLSPDTTMLRRYTPEMTKIVGEAAYQRGDTLFWNVMENVTPEWYEHHDYILEAAVYASVNGEWFKTEVEWDTANVKRDTSGTLPDAAWKFVETRGVLRAITYSRGIWEWNGKQWQKADLLGRGENTPLPLGAVRGAKFYRDIVEHDGTVWIAELDGYIESSSDMMSWDNHWDYYWWDGSNETATGTTHALHPYKDKMLIGSGGGVLQWVKGTNQWVPIDIADCFERKTTRAPRTSYTGWGPPGLVHEFVILGDTLVAGVADYHNGLSGVYMFDLKEANWR